MNTIKCMSYAFYVLRHPFDGFWCLKSEQRGSLKTAGAWMLLFAATMLIRIYATDYLVSSVSVDSFSPWLLLIIILGVYFLFVVSNWSLTTLMEGSGSFKDIAIFTAYALVPVTLVNIPITLLSHMITLSEIAFYNAVNTISVIWTAALLLAANMSTHDYSMKKSIVTAVLTVLIMIIIVALGFLFLNLLQQVWVFFTSVVREILFRL